MYGQERGQEALAEAMAYAWEHFDELCEMRTRRATCTGWARAARGPAEATGSCFLPRPMSDSQPSNRAYRPLWGR